jgi:uncharacterized protein (TIGR02145 family)
MKKTFYLVFVLAFVLVANAFGQKPTIELTFTAQYQTQYVPLDSIYVENLTQGGDTILYALDTVLVLDFITGIAANTAFNTGFRVSQNHPNPFTGQTIISIFLPEADHLQVSVTNLLGQKVAFFERSLDAGSHSFVFYPGDDKYYILTATANGLTETIKMVSLNNHFGTSSSLSYKGADETHAGYKFSQDINDFGYSLGDQLRFIGYTKTPALINGSDVIEDAPQSNQTYIFEVVEGIPCPGSPAVIYEGQTYNTVLIGNQCWFKENLNVGTMIDSSSNQTNNSLIEKYCYGDDPANCATYGGLYQWDEMMQYTTQQGTQGICPAGWHLPSDADWTILTDFLGGEPIAGGKMKETGTLHWLPPNNGATNESGFTALPGGARSIITSFVHLHNNAYFWSTTEGYTQNAWGRDIDYNDPNVFRSNYIKINGINVRCMKDFAQSCPGTPTVNDIDGNVYNTVLIGNQCWMKENLKTTTYRNGTAIPNVMDDNAWYNLTTGAYVWYDNDISWKDSYGALYNWFATVDANGLCPTGFHVPTDDEWTALTDYIGGMGSPHGNELKSCRQVNSPLGGGCSTDEHPRWDHDNANYGTDDYGFSGLPGGSRGYSGNFDFIGYYGIWWSSTEYSSGSAWYHYLSYYYGYVSVSDYYKQIGISVRCLRD